MSMHGSFLRRALTLAALVAATLVPASAVPITGATIIADWTRGPDPTTGQPFDNWIAIGAGVRYTVASQGQAIFSDFTTAGDYTFTSRVTGLSGDDMFGLVFNYTDSSNGYWLAFTGGPIFGRNGILFTREVGGTETALFANAALNWATGQAYDLTVGRSGNTIFFNIDQVGVGNVAAFSIVDTTFLGGSVGLFTASQDADFVNIDFSTQMAPVPEPSSGLLLLSALAGLIYFRRKRK